MDSLWLVLAPVFAIVAVHCWVISVVAVRLHWACLTHLIRFVLAVTR